MSNDTLTHLEPIEIPHGESPATVRRIHILIEATEFEGGIGTGSVVLLDKPLTENLFGMGWGVGAGDWHGTKKYVVERLTALLNEPLADPQETQST